MYDPLYVDPTTGCRSISCNSRFIAYVPPSSLSYTNALLLRVRQLRHFFVPISLQIRLFRAFLQPLRVTIHFFPLCRHFPDFPRQRHTALH